MLEVGELGSDYLKGTGFFWREETFFNKVVVKVVQHCECTKCHGVVHFKWFISWTVNFASKTKMVFKKEAIGNRSFNHKTLLL